MKLTESQQRDWNLKSQPEHLPSPTYWPFFLALGIMFMGWGILSSWLISLAGGIVFVISLIGWINNLRHERNN